jgi:hypothetical protein
VLKSSVTAVTNRMTSAESSVNSALTLTGSSFLVTSINDALSAVGTSPLVSAVTNLRSDLTAAQTSSTNLAARLSAVESLSGTSTIVHAVLTLQQQVANTANALASNGVTDSSQQLQALNATLLSVSAIVQEHSNLLAQITALNSSNLAGTVSALSVSITVLQQHDLTNTQGLSGLTADMSALTTRVNTLDTSAAALTSRITQAEGLTGTTQLAITAASHTNQINALVAANASSVAVTSALTVRVSSAEVATSAVVSAVAAYASQLANLQSANSNLTARVVVLERMGGVVVDDNSQSVLVSPLTVMAIGQNEQAVVSWNMTRFTVTAFPGGQSCSTYDSSCIVPNLDHRVSYIFSVVATNAAGTGPAVVSNTVTPMRECYQLSIAVAGGVGGSISVVPSSPHSCANGWYPPLSNLTLNAIASQLWVFQSWSGTKNDSFTQLNVSIGASSGVTELATFVQCFPLTLLVAGNGNVTASPVSSPGCPAHFYLINTLVTLTAAATDSIYQFSNFTDLGGAGGSSLATPFLWKSSGASTTIMAMFYVPCYPLSLSVLNGAGGMVSVTPAWSLYCPTGSYQSTANLTFIASASPGWTFQLWNGTASSANAVLSVTVGKQAVNQVATFVQCYSLVLAQGTGGSSVAASPASSLNCAAGSYVAGAQIQLSATALSNYSFGSWAQNITGGSHITTVFTSSFTFTMPASNTTQLASFLAWVACSITVYSTLSISAVTNSHTIFYTLRGGGGGGTTTNDGFSGGTPTGGAGLSSTGNFSITVGQSLAVYVGGGGGGGGSDWGGGGKYALIELPCIRSPGCSSLWPHVCVTACGAHALRRRWLRLLWSGQHTLLHQPAWLLMLCTSRSHDCSCPNLLCALCGSQEEGVREPTVVSQANEMQLSCSQLLFE